MPEQDQFHERRIERYVLHDLMSEAGSIRLWRAMDEVLERPVTIRLIDREDPRAESLCDSARRSAGVDDRRLVRVLDVVEFESDVGVVTEWVSGRTLSDLLDERSGEPLDAGSALALATEVGRGVLAGHHAGVGHGRLRPSSILITDSGEVRVIGLGVDSALWGPSLPARVGVDPDVHGVGALLYAAVTGHWPDGLLDGLPAAPRAGRRVLPPSSVVADVPLILDELAARSIAGMTPPRARLPYADMDDLVAALAQAPNRLAATTLATFAPRPMRPRSRTALGLGAAVVAAGCVGVGLLGWRIIQGAPSPWAAPSSAVASDFLTAPVDRADEAAAVPTDAASAPIVIAKVFAFDPFGVTTRDPEQKGGRAFGAETVPRIVDGDSTSAWLTPVFDSPDLGGSRGTGVILDLGESVPIRSVVINLMGNGTDLQVHVADELGADYDLWPLLNSVTGASTRIDVRSPRSLEGRYVLIWLTRVPPYDTGGYLGGIRSVEVRS